MTTPMSIDDIMHRQPVIPVLTVETLERAVPLAEALVAQGLPVLEVTLRTPAALDVIRAMANVPGAIVGAGTVLTPAQAERAALAGAQFIVTPGLSAETVAAAAKAHIPILPGVATPTEIMAGLSLGLNRFKFFPAEQAGGRKMLDALHGPFADVKFCPTGGIGFDLVESYLALPNVICVGGGWIAPKRQVEEAAWSEIRYEAARAAAMKRM